MDSEGDEMCYNLGKLKGFHIPKKREQHDKKGLLSELTLQSRDFTHTLYPAIKSSFFYPTSSRKLRIEKVELVHNATLQEEFSEKRKSMKDEGRSEKELAECYAFILCKEKLQVEKICQNGLETGNTGLVSLGKPAMGVYVCKHADIVSPTNFVNNDRGYIIIFKIIKGKTKVVTECRTGTTTQEPTPNFDCHTTKQVVDQSKNHIRAFQALQYYIYEYGDEDMVKRPRQIVPYAVLQVRYIAKEAAAIPRRESFIRRCMVFQDKVHFGANIGALLKKVVDRNVYGILSENRLAWQWRLPANGIENVFTLEGSVIGARWKFLLRAPCN